VIVTALPPEANPQPQLTEAEIIAWLKQTVSASRLALFLACRLKFYYRYVAKIDKAKSAALHVGTTVHTVLSLWNKARWKGSPLTAEQIDTAYSRAWDDQEAEPINWEDDNEQDAEKQLGRKLLKAYFQQTPILPNSKPDAVEVSIEADLAAHGLPKLIGILDLVQDGKIVDFKTTGQTPNPERAVHTNEIQLSVYSMLYREATNRDEAGMELHHLVKLKTPKVVVTSLPPATEHQHTRLFHLIEAYVDGLQRNDFVPSPGLQCSFCEFFNECRAWH
jgi:putative RecB family exonuclease